MLTKAIVLLAALTLALLCGVKGQTVKVVTPAGALRGNRTVINDTYVDIFGNIPFARPPVGNLRFRAPQLPVGWEGERDATRLGPRCPQPKFSALVPGVTDNPQGLEEKEDCLYLNVYIPKTSEGAQPLPVMVWIHGGAFYLGSGADYNPSLLAMRGVVVVTINYRLGPLGFLCTEDGASPGNYGLLDQIRALQWVRDSIAAFNGNPGDVTIFGESAGSGSVSLLVMSGKTKGLFQKAIMESGVSLTPWATGRPRVPPQPREYALTLAERMGCDVTGDSTDVIDCLRGKDAKLISLQTLNITIETGTFPFRPVPETTFGQFGVLAAVPESILENGWFNNVTTIRGYNKDETAAAQLDPDDDGMTVEEFRAQCDFNFGVYVKNDDQRLRQICDVMMEDYITSGNVTDPKQIRAALVQMITDFTFVVPTLRELKSVTKFPSPPQYLYRFSYRSQNRANPEWMGAIHADEVRYVFGFPWLLDMYNTTDPYEGSFVSSYTTTDYVISGAFIDAWTNFAKYGNPRGFNGVDWLPWTPEAPSFMDIRANSQLVTSSPTKGQNAMMGKIWDLIYNAQSDLIG